MTSKFITLLEVESPSSNSPPVELEVINKSPLSHFNPPLPNTLDFILQEVNIIDSDVVSLHYIVMSMGHETSYISSPSSTIPSVYGGFSMSPPISLSCG